MLSRAIALALMCVWANSVAAFEGTFLVGSLSGGTPTYSPPPSQPAGGGPMSFSPPPLTGTPTPAAPASTAASSAGVAVLPAGAAIFSDSGAIGAGNTYAAFDTVFEHLNAGLSGQDGGMADTALSFAPMVLAFNDKQITQLDDAGLAFPTALRRSGAWARGIGSFQSAHSAGAAPGYRGQSGGFLTGIDRGFTPDLTIGIAGGYSHTDLTQSDGTSGTIETPRFIAYGLYRTGPVALEGTLGVAYDRISTTRPISTNSGATAANASEGHNGFEKNAALQAAYPLSVGDIALVPHLGLQYVRLDENKFAESGAGSANLAAGSSASESLQPSIGASLLKAISFGNDVTLIPALKASYARELLDTSRNLVLTSAAGNAVNAFGISAAHNTVIIGPAVTARLGDTLELTGDYKLTLGLGKSTGHTVIAGARAAF